MKRTPAIDQWILDRLAEVHPSHKLVTNDYKDEWQVVCSACLALMRVLTVPTPVPVYKEEFEQPLLYSCLEQQIVAGKAVSPPKTAAWDMAAEIDNEILNDLMAKSWKKAKEWKTEWPAADHLPFAGPPTWGQPYGWPFSSYEVTKSALQASMEGFSTSLKGYSDETDAFITAHLVESFDPSTDYWKYAAKMSQMVMGGLGVMGLALAS